MSSMTLVVTSTVAVALLLGGDGERALTVFSSGFLIAVDSQTLVPSLFSAGRGLEEPAVLVLDSKEERTVEVVTLVLTFGEEGAGLRASDESEWWKRERAFFTTDGLSSIGLPAVLAPATVVFTAGDIDSFKRLFVSLVVLVGSTSGSFCFQFN